MRTRWAAALERTRKARAEIDAFIASPDWRIPKHYKSTKLVRGRAAINLGM